MALLGKADKATASALSAELMFGYALSKLIVSQHILTFFNGEVLGKWVHKQVTVLCADGAVALVGGVLVQGRGYREVEPHGSAMAIAGVGATLASGGWWKWHIEIGLGLFLRTGPC